MQERVGADARNRIAAGHVWNDHDLIGARVSGDGERSVIRGESELGLRDRGQRHKDCHQANLKYFLL